MIVNSHYVCCPEGHPIESTAWALNNLFYYHCMTCCYEVQHSPNSPCIISVKKAVDYWVEEDSQPWDNLWQ